MRGSRKIEHIRHALQIGATGMQGMSDIRFIHNSLPESTLRSISLHTTIGELKLSSPIIINAMTGGARETAAINGELASAACERGVAIAVGSQMAAIKSPDDAEIRKSYTIVRERNPKGIVFANLGGEATVEQAERAVEMLRADAIQIHLNAMQELIMPEGDRSFQGVTERIARIVSALRVPVIVKEVGFGLSAGSARRLKQAGVRIVDVGGRGGTSFAAIENARRAEPLHWLDDWGNVTSVALLECLSQFAPGAVIASGGIATSLDAAKALAVGASAVGIAGTFLRIVQQEGATGLSRAIGELESGLALIMTALGAHDIAGLQRVPLVIGGETAEWCRLRGIPLEDYARRDM